MPTSITIRGVPDEVRDALAAHAARSGRSLQAYLRTALVDLARREKAAVVLARARARVDRTGSRLPRERILDHLRDDRR